MMKTRDDLIYELIFSDVNEFEINVSDYIDNVYQYELFIKDIKQILKKSKVSVIKESIQLNPNYVLWELKVKK